MSTYKIQGLRELRDEMKEVARGTRPAPEDAAAPSFNSVEALQASPRVRYIGRGSACISCRRRRTEATDPCGISVRSPHTGENR